MASAVPQTARQTLYPPASITQPPSNSTTSVTAGGLTRQTAQGSFVISDDMMRASLKSAIEGKVRRRLTEVFAQSQVL